MINFNRDILFIVLLFFDVFSYSLSLCYLRRSRLLLLLLLCRCCLGLRLCCLSRCLRLFVCTNIHLGGFLRLILNWSRCLVVMFQNFNFGTPCIQFSDEVINWFLLLIILDSYWAFKVHFNTSLGFIFIELTHSFIIHCLVYWLAFIHPLKHGFQFLDFTLILLQQSIFWILIDFRLVLNCFCSWSISEGRQSFFVVVVGWRNCSDHDSFCVTTERVLQQAS